MKSTDHFKSVIEGHLQGRAKTDPLFAGTLANPGKNIDDCITYIINEVHKSGCNGFADDEIFGMAAHYYDEENIEVGQVRDCRVVTNHRTSAQPKSNRQSQSPIPKKPEPEQQLSLFQ